MVDLLLGVVPCRPLASWEGGAVLLNGRGALGGLGWMTGPVEEYGLRERPPDTILGLVTVWYRSTSDYVDGNTGSSQR